MIHCVIELLQDQGVEHDVLNYLLLGAQYALDRADYVDVAERFNQTFAKNGWIATESLRLDIMRQALAHHEKARFEESEEVILEWFDPPIIKILAIGRCGYFGDHNLRKDQLE